MKLVGLRRKIAEHMVEAKRHIPHYSYIDECDLTDLVRLRAQLREPLAKTGVKLTYLAFFVKAVARALKDVPIVNSTFDEAAGEMVLHDHYHIGVAVAAPGGLIVPVVKDADKKDLPTIAARDRPAQHRRQGRQEQARGPARRHVHGHVDRQHRRADLDADHQPPRGRHHGRRQGGEAAGVRRQRRPEAARTSSTCRSRSTTASWTARSGPRSATRWCATCKPGAAAVAGEGAGMSGRLW